jgi:hypothetical protein
MFESIVIVTVVGLVLYLVSKYIEYARFKRVREEIISNITAIEQHIKEHLVVLRVEKHNSILFAYNYSTGEFIAQGKDLEEMDKHFKDRCPGKKGVVIEGGEYITEFFEKEKAHDGA